MRKKYSLVALSDSSSDHDVELFCYRVALFSVIIRWHCWVRLLVQLVTFVYVTFCCSHSIQRQTRTYKRKTGSLFICPKEPTEAMYTVCTRIEMANAKCKQIVNCDTRDRPSDWITICSLGGGRYTDPNADSYAKTTTVTNLHTFSCLYYRSIAVALIRLHCYVGNIKQHKNQQQHIQFYGFPIRLYLYT